MNILGTGLTGLVGSRIIELLAGSFSFENLSLETGIDITQKDIVSSYISKTDAPWVWHFAAMTNVDSAEKEKGLGTNSSTWKVNVEATENIVEACKLYNKKLLYLSTDFVFDGIKDIYSEEDKPNPQGWYAQTKYEGEKRVAALGDACLIVRIANPYKAKQVGKPDFVETICERLKNGLGVTSATDQLFVPTYIDDIAYALQKLIEKDAHGIYHVVGSQALSPYEACIKIAASNGFDERLVAPTTFSEYFKNRAPRPFHAVLNNDKIAKLGVAMISFDTGLTVIKKYRDTQT
jgi:dTDP-4-dehydrorhamnose reductase